MNWFYFLNEVIIFFLLICIVLNFSLFISKRNLKNNKFLIQFLKIFYTYSKITLMYNLITG